MSLEDRAKATGKNLEGKAQEALGNVTGDPEDKAEGKAKQAEAQGRHAGEDLKDKAKDVIDNV
ncbi:MAG TPA: CsbD family protein [Phormidium sp.]